MQKKILIIDDSQSLTWLLEKLLKNQYQVIKKEDGMDAMYWLSDGNIPDLIVTDLNMPNLNGIDLIANLKKSGIFQEIPIIILSGSEDKVVLDKCKEYGAIDYLEKPFNPGLFMARVKKILGDEHAKVGAA